MLLDGCPQAMATYRLRKEFHPNFWATILGTGGADQRHVPRVAGEASSAVRERTRASSDMRERDTIEDDTRCRQAGRATADVPRVGGMEKTRALGAPPART